jgi:hypothetical protein
MRLKPAVSGGCGDVDRLVLFIHNRRKNEARVGRTVELPGRREMKPGGGSGVKIMLEYC